MKKNYLFDKILLDNGKGIKFKPFRSASPLESFMANCHSTFNQEEWEFIPVSEKDFLKMLSMTIVKIGNSDYEQGVPSSSDNGNSSSGTTTSSGGDNTSSTTPIVDNGGSRVIFIGDSRTVQMYSYVANTWKNNSYSTGGIT